MTQHSVLYDYISVRVTQYVRAIQIELRCFDERMFAEVVS